MYFPNRKFTINFFQLAKHPKPFTPEARDKDVSVLIKKRKTLEDDDSNNIKSENDTQLNSQVEKHKRDSKESSPDIPEDKLSFQKYNFFNETFKKSSDLLKVAPDYEGIELGVGETVLMKAIASATGKNLNRVKSESEKLGDLGEVAMAFRLNQKTLFPLPDLTIDKVFDTFHEISATSGSSSQQKKVEKISSLIVSGKNSESKYIVRSLEGKLRIGLAEKTVLSALGRAFVTYKAVGKTPTTEQLTEAIETIKHVYTQLPNYKILITNLIEHGIKNLEDVCKLIPGIPVKPMLAHPTKSVTEVLNRFENMNFTCEYKYDGERIQIHKSKDIGSISFSRNSENTTDKYKDIISKSDQFCASHTESFIIDAEVVAWDVSKKCILPFQVLSTRKRKDVKENEISVQVCLFVFDILFLNGESLLQKPLNARRDLLKEAFILVPGLFQFAISKDLRSVDEIQNFLEESIAVVVGAYTGRGKRTGVYGGFLLACYDPDREEYQSICKIGTGFSEEDLDNFKKILEPLTINQPKSYYSYGDSTKPDVWFEPSQVWEVKAADLSISPVYKAAIGIISEDKGISLRFPRFLRIRDDKSPEECTSSSQIADMFESQNLNTAS
ncbi:DNA ligase 1 [Smittium mucronatum]|uniref:DNA ligase n=1 Tax=Smittium mucronatum TaxID=133383 RepID=A0A1R0GV22_9FUNG|nr:DNA ligase 1 [Smittium mucronatum]